MAPSPNCARQERAPEPRKVRYWSIGNENWGGHEIGAKTPQEWGPLVARSAELMQAVDPGLKLLAAATPDRNWTLAPAAGRREASRLCCDSRVLAALLGREPHARLPDLYHALGRAGEDDHACH